MQRWKYLNAKENGGGGAGTNVMVYLERKSEL